MHSKQVTRFLVGAVATIVLLFQALPLTAQQQPTAALPTAEQITAHFIDAVGGSAALRRYSSSTVFGTFGVPAQGMSGDLEIVSAAPNKLFVRITLPGFGEVTTGYDGEVAWAMNPAVGPTVMEGRELDQMRQQANYYGPLTADLFIDSAQTVERTDFDGHPCYAVKVFTKWGESYVEYYDVETGLVAGTVRTQSTPMGEVEMTSFVRGYRDFGGVLTPTESVQRAMGVEQRITVDSVTYGAVDPAVFELPEAIKALVGGN